LLTAAHAVAAIQTFIASAASYSNVPAYIAGGRIALHYFCVYVYNFSSNIFSPQNNR
jgi:hypothetical protein